MAQRRIGNSYGILYTKEQAITHLQAVEKKELRMRG
jgi:hypothetical protein